MTRPVLGTGAYDRWIKPALFRLSAESAHDLSLAALALASSSSSVLAIVARRFVVDDPRLQVECFGLTFANPLGLAAGLDKNAVAVPAWAALGFGSIEIGTVTPRPQSGNPKPRAWRIPADRAIVNAMGFPGEGAERVAARLRDGLTRLHDRRVRIGVNVGKNAATPLDEAADDYVAALVPFLGMVDFVTVNVSSPNTAGLRALQGAEYLYDLVSRVVAAATGVPVLVKIAPDVHDADLSGIVAATTSAGASGIVATNTTVSRAGLLHDPGRAGGLSGRPLAPRSRFVTHSLRRLTEAPLVSVGGIDGPEEAVRRLEVGADLLQVYTGLIYGGPAFAHALLRGLVAAMDAAQVARITDLRSTRSS